MPPMRTALKAGVTVGAGGVALRGTLALGKLADLAVLSKDYLTVPVEEIGGIQSLLTLVGGRAVYADGPFATLEERR